MANIDKRIKFVTGIVDPLLDRAPFPVRNSFPLWATACLLVEPARDGLVDPDAKDFPMQAMDAIRNASDWTLHHDRAEMVFRSEDPFVLEILMSACRQAREYSVGRSDV